ncbi:hypothetical protein [Amycolatopsis sp. cmx-11-51]|uniref:hypothetical protein n=1 Tax=Amycolatopsis sp. cmx-11-51 TaxID=2785797 RepID=UPI0039E60384
MPENASPPPLTVNPVTGEPISEGDTVAFRVRHRMQAVVSGIAERLLGGRQFAVYNLGERATDPRISPRNPDMSSPDQ